MFRTVAAAAVLFVPIGTTVALAQELQPAGRRNSRLRPVRRWVRSNWIIWSRLSRFIPTRY